MKGFISIAAVAATAAAGTYALKSAAPLATACVHHRGGGLYVAKRCARGDNRMRIASKVITATGTTGPNLKPGSYYVTVTADLGHSSPDPITGFCVVFLPAPPAAQDDLMGGAFALGPGPGSDATAPGAWASTFSYSGVIALTDSAQPRFGCVVTSSAGSVSVHAKWWVASA